TGDNKNNAERVSAELNIDDTYYSLMPQDKLNIVNKLKKKNKKTAFVGDGINDAPVIAASDCGFAMGLGSDAAISSADAVLSSGNLKALPKAFSIARKTVMTAKTNITFALSVKAAVIILAALGFAPIWLGVLADTGICMLCVLWAVRLLKIKL
ncbi:MAG: HAD-IC family P-type ATPase, partial [Ruminococcus sp.]|nr:HAD-IC family P-type ATPase [Ruminococcus sp.]